MAKWLEVLVFEDGKDKDYPMCVNIDKIAAVVPNLTQGSITPRAIIRMVDSPNVIPCRESYDDVLDKLLSVNATLCLSTFPEARAYHKIDEEEG